jgi:hypothetical protein
MKPLKPLKNAHTPNTKFGMGDNYGTAVKNPLGKMRGDSMGMKAVTPKALKQPPRKLA